MYKTCHTESSSRRQRELEAGLLAALQDQRYEKVTLTELCRKLEIPRKSFYRYFPAKDDCLLALVDHTLADCNTVALTGWDGSPEVQRMHLARFFAYWLEHSVFLDVMRDNGFQSLLLERTTVLVDAMKKKEPPLDFARDQVEYFIAHGLMATVLRWHHFGYQSTPEEMGDAFAPLLHSADISLSRLLL